jgi:hypothetical protein
VSATGPVALTIMDLPDLARRTRKLNGWGESDQSLPPI